MVSCDIPLHKLSMEKYITFMKRYTGRTVPHPMTLRKYYVSGLYSEIMDKLRSKVKNKRIWVSLDESTDVEQRFVVASVFGILDEQERDNSYFSNIAVLDRVNHSTLAFLHDSLQWLWPDRVMFQSVLLVVTDAAPYMKEMNGFQVRFSKMIHVTCLAHCLHRVAELVRNSYPDDNLLEACTKSIFIKAHQRIQKFKDIAPGMPLPPAPVVTLWRTWLDSKYNADNSFNCYWSLWSWRNYKHRGSLEFDAMRWLKISLISIANNFNILSTTITKLEATGIWIAEVWKLVNDVQSSKIKWQEIPREINTRVKKKQRLLYN